MPAVVDLKTDDDYRSFIALPGVQVIDFWAEWCAPCKQLSPILEAIADARPEIRFAKIDADALREIASSLNVGGLPATIIFRDGSVVGQIIGAKPRMLFEHEIAKYLDA